jgi:hypothetical protein
MASYEKQRNAASMQLYRQNTELARFNPVTEEELAIRAPLLGNQDETNRFYLAQDGIIPPEEFFYEDNLRRLKTQAGMIGSAHRPLHGPSIPSMPQLAEIERAQEIRLKESMAEYRPSR